MNTSDYDKVRLFGSGRAFVIYQMKWMLFFAALTLGFYSLLHEATTHKKEEVTKEQHRTLLAAVSLVAAYLTLRYALLPLCETQMMKIDAGLL